MSDALDIDLSPLQDRPGSALIVAFSGGLDSTVLLHALANHPGLQPRRLRAVHVNHGLHADAERWQAHCAAVCAALGVPFDACRVRVSRDGDGPEAAARKARHAALAGAAAAGDVIALAHHLDDQAETFLLRALRASGPDGLQAMRPWRSLGQAWLWRPLLDLPRDRLAMYARAHGLQWVDDASNLDPGYDRNFLRLQVMPLLRQRWPHAAAALATSARRTADDVGLLIAGDAEALAQVRVDAWTLDAGALARLPRERRARVLRAWTASLGLPALPARGVQQVEAALLVARDDANACFRWHDAHIRRWRGLLRAGRAAATMPSGWQATWAGPEALPLPDGGMLRTVPPHAFAAPLAVRARRGGERIRLPGRAHTHALKHVLQDRGVPPWEREHLPLLFDGDGELEAAGDVVVGARLAARLSAAGVRLHWERRAAVDGR